MWGKVGIKATAWRAAGGLPTFRLQSNPDWKQVQMDAFPPCKIALFLISSKAQT